MKNISSLPIRVAVLDDHALVRQGIKASLATESDVLIVGDYANGRDLIVGLRSQPADVLLIDYALGPVEVDGISLIRTLRVKFPDARILVVSSYYDPATVALAIRAGACGFVGKGQNPNEMIKAIRVIALGGIYPNPEMSHQLADMNTKASAEEGNPAEEILSGAMLSPREREVIRCYQEGMTVTQIAEKFGRSVKTISTQKSMAFKKLGVSSDNAFFMIKHRLSEM